MTKIFNLHEPKLCKRNNIFSDYILTSQYTNILLKNQINFFSGPTLQSIKKLLLC